ncbi:unnamed protein product [Chrysodeixis includens]|uniref:Uncharacterized protein n=1 Tax=Chrysodeixis includens TaxID=689277 RepID=A0A9P0BLP3_CHRIL|nr:unnamed protein product [Chrysodeixis includens]
MKDLNENMYQRLEYEQSYITQEESPCAGAENKWKVYRCQLSTKEESCCCSCNSDAMFEVMKSLYDCYKKKNCDDCNCILCGHLPREERRLGKIRKSLLDVGLAGSEKERKKKIKQAAKQLEGKSEAEKEAILRELAKTGQPLPEAKTASDKAIMQKVRTDLGLPPEPKTAAEKEKMKKAEQAGLIVPLEGKTAAQKEKILKAQLKQGIELPKGRTPSEKAIIQKLKPAATVSKGVTSEKVRKAKEAGLLTPLEGKTPEQQEKILKGLAMQGMPLPEGKTASEKRLIEKVRADLGLPPEPKSSAMKAKYTKAAEAGLLQPLEGKTNKEKEKILQGLQDKGISLPEGRTASEKALIAKIKKAEPLAAIPSEKLRKAKEAGLITPLEGKTAEQKEKIIRGLANQGLPLPEAKTASEKKIVDKVRKELGLPPEPKTQEMKDKEKQAAEAGLLQPLEGKTAKEKEKILQGLHDMGVTLPEGRTKSEKSLVAKIKKSREPLAVTPSERARKAKKAGLMTPLEGKTAEQKEKIIRGLANQGLPLPEAKTASEKKIVDKVRKELGLPPEPKTQEMKDKQKQAAEAGLLQPLEGKTAKEKEKILQGLHDMGVTLPEGRTKSEKSLVAKIKKSREPLAVTPSERARKAKEAGLITPLEGKTAEQKEKIIRGLANQGLPLPEAKTASEKKIVDKVRKELGLPPEPKTQEMKDKQKQAAEAGLLQPLEGKTAKEKEKILQGLHDMGVTLPEGRTKSEKSLVAKIKKSREPLAVTPSEKLRKAKEAGLITPLEGKTAEQKEKIIRGLAKQGIPLPEGKTASEKKIVDKVRKELGLPPEPKTQEMKDKQKKAADAGLLQPLEGKTAKEKEKILQGLHDMGVTLPEGRTKSEKSLVAKIKKSREPLAVTPSEKLRKAKEAGLITPLEGKTAEQKEKIIRGLAKQGIPLPEGKTASEKKIVDKVRKELGLPPEPKTQEMKDKQKKAADAGLLQPLEGKTAKEKEKILQGLHDMGVTLPEGRTKSEKSLVAKIKAGPKSLAALTPSEKLKKIKSKEKALAVKSQEVVLSPSEKLRKAKAAGLITPLEGKTPEQREKILKGLAMHGLPLPEGKTASEKRLIDKVRTDLGLPPEPKNLAMRGKYTKAADAGLLQPLEGKSHKEKEKILQGLHNLDIPLPEGRTASEKALIAKIQAEPKGPPAVSPSEKLRKAKAAGLITPLTGKSPAQREKILRGLAMQGVPLPEGKTPSEKMLIDKVRADLGLPPEPKNAALRDKYNKAADAGLMQPLEGKSQKEKERVLKGLRDMGIPLPEGRTASEKALIAKVLSPTGKPSESEKARKAKSAGLITPLEGKSPAQKEKILRGLAMQGLPLPEAKTASEKKLLDKVRADLALPPEPKSPAMKEKYEQAAKAGILQPLEGKSNAEKEKILQALHNKGLPLPEGRTKSEKSLVAKVKAGARPSLKLIPSEKLRKAQAAGLITPLDDKSPEQREKILRGLGTQGIPLPEGKSPSEKMIIDKVKADLGLPPTPKTAAERDKYNKAIAAGLITPLEGKTPAEKEKILRAQQEAGIALPKGRTASERDLINKIKSEKPKSRAVSVGAPPLPPDKRAKLDEKTAKGIKEGSGPVDECICGLLTPESERETPPPFLKPSKKLKAAAAPSVTSAKIRKAKEAGLLTPLEGKTPEQREKILKGLAATGLPLPEGKTASEKMLIKKIKSEMGVPEKSSTEKVQKAKLAGILTPLQGKRKSKQEKILRGRAAAGLPLPVGKTPSEKALIQKIKKDTGYTTPSPSERMRRAKAAGLLTPIEGKTIPQKEKILKERLAAGVPLPEGKTPSEKELIRKVLAEGPPVATPSERLKKAKAAGVLTPLQGKSAKEKEKIIRGLIKARVPLPEPKSASEKNLMDKIRREVGLPPEPSTTSLKEKERKAQEAGLITPLEGKTKAEKEKVLKRLHDAGMRLPEGRTASEKSMIKKVKAQAPEPKTASEKAIADKLRKSKAMDIITPLEGKSSAEKEKILKGMAKAGIPLPETKTTSDRKLTGKIRKEIGLPPEPKTASMKDRHEKAAAAGLLKPLEGLSPAEKERVLKGQADLGLELPEGRTPSEKELISKIKAESKLPPSKVASDRIQRAKAAGLLTPLKGKKAADKEKIMRGLAKEGLPLPDQTPSEKKIANKVRKDLGLPPEPTTKEMKDKYDKAAKAGILVPLEGLTTPEKENLLKAQAEMGIPLPEGRTASEKALIAKIKAEKELSPVSSKKLKKAKAEGLLTPLEGKSHAEKERILQKLAEAGLPLPEGKTASEKALIQKVRAEHGKPPPAKTASEKAVVQKAKRDGLLTPIKGKPPKEKERILKGLAEAGLPMPEGKTASEKVMIKKVRAAAGLPPEPTPSEKRGEIKTKSRSVGAKASRKSKAKGIGEGGIAAEFEDIIKSTTCDRGCGCDKKKIRFKHSYVKIRVTSPDISSLCPCPNECIPGVKAGAFVDNEGIKVTVGRVKAATSYTSQYSIHSLESSKQIITLYDKIHSNRYSSNTSIDTLDALLDSNTVTNDLQQTRDQETSSQGCLDKNSKMNHGQPYSSSSYSSNSYDSPASYATYIKESDHHSPDRWIDGKDRFLDATGYLEALGEIYRRPMFICYSSDDTATELSPRGSFDSILVTRSESSLSLTASDSSVDVISVISFSSSSTDSNTTHYLYCPVSGGNFSDSTVEELECFTNRIDYSATDTITSTSNSLITKLRCHETHSKIIGNSRVIETTRQRSHNEYLTLRMSQMDLCQDNNMAKMSTRITNTGEPVIVINNLNSEHDITTMVDHLLSKNEFSDASSIFVVVPTSDDSDGSLDSVDSTICIQEFEYVNQWNRNQCGNDKEVTVSAPKNMSATQGLRISTRGRKSVKDVVHKHVSLSQHKDTVIEIPGYECMHAKQRSRINEICNKQLLSNRSNIASTDTTADRPCCCTPTETNDAVQNPNSNHQCAANVVSELFTPLLVTQGLGCDPYRRIASISENQQASFVSMNLPPTPVGACQIPPCSHRVGCHDPPRPLPRRDKPKPCQCSPEKLREMLAEATKKKPAKLKTTGCGGTPPIQNPEILVPPPKAPPPTPKITFQPTVPDPEEEDCPACSKPKFKDGGTIICACSGKKKTIKMRALCPCEQFQPPVSDPALGPKTGTRSYGSQFCNCDDPPCDACPRKLFGILSKKSASKPGYTDVLGPDGGSVLMEAGGTYIQAGRRDIPDSKKKCVCKNKRRKKKKNVTCECPSEQESDLNEQSVSFEFSYDQLMKYKLYEQKLALKQKSDMTQTLSGFTVLKKKKPPPVPEPEFTIEDAVKLYATLNPEVLKDLCPPPPDFCETTKAEDCDCEDDKKKSKSKADCECPYEPPPPPPEPVKEEEGPFRGLKLKMSGKGSGSKGIGGVCCFDMIEELYISKQHSKER